MDDRCPRPSFRVAVGVSLALRSQSRFPSPNTIFPSSLFAESVWAASSHLLRPRRELLSHRKPEKTLDNNFGTRIFSPIISHPSILFSHRPSSLSHGRGPLLRACLSPASSRLPG